MEFILHHFDASPFAEKIRLLMGLKGLSWQSVQIPMVMPKPDLTALTGGYRKTPVLQIGADIYCDTRRIAIELEARAPEPSAFPGGSQDMALALASWSDTFLFQPGAGLSMGTNADLPAEILKDRFAFFDFLDQDSLDHRLPHLFSQFVTGLRQLDGMLSDGRRWLLDDGPSWADIACYTPVWMCRGNIQGADELLAPLEHLARWERSVAEFGHGERLEMAAADALQVARAGKSIARVEVAEDCFPALEIGQGVAVVPADYGAVPVQGELLRLTHTDIAIQRSDAQTGDVVVHFPRAGYEVNPL